MSNVTALFGTVGIFTNPLLIIENNAPMIYTNTISNFEAITS